MDISARPETLMTTMLNTASNRKPPNMATMRETFLMPRETEFDFIMMAIVLNQPGRTAIQGNSTGPETKILARDLAARAN